jgi:hypothetical protein
MFSRYLCPRPESGGNVVQGAKQKSADGLGADNAADLADNTLDMMVGRELKGDDFMSVNEMRDELYQCTSPNLSLSSDEDHRMVWKLTSRSFSRNRDLSHDSFMGTSVAMTRANEKWIKYMTIFPDIQRKLRKHVLESMPELQDRPPTLEDLTPGKLPYLEAVVQETLRLSRTAGGYSRDGESFP